MYKSILIFSLAFISINLFAQNGRSFEIGGAAGSSVGSISAAGFKHWGLGAKKKFYVGTGLRFNATFGNDVNFITAPADLTVDEKNIDTLLAPKPSLNSLNLMISLGYKLSEKIDIGFNIDALGFSFGPKGTPSYIRNGKSTQTEASPTTTNILLVGDNDKGSLNSHLYGRYKLTEKMGIKLAYQFLFNELTTTTKVQTIPSANDRFRAKLGMVYLGLNFSF